jgi:putative transposase
LKARGDGGKPGFEDDKDHYGWVDLLEKACERFGWRVHAWVLMGNPARTDPNGIGPGR